jgi:micrococcal nuclease
MKRYYTKLLKFKYFLLVLCLSMLLPWFSGCAAAGDYAAESEKMPSQQTNDSGLDSRESPSPAVENRVQHPDSLKSVQVIWIVDGDTIKVKMAGNTEKVRLIGVDTPELNHPTRGEEPYALAARKYTQSQLANKSVLLEFDVEKTDQYGRLLAYVWLEKQMFNEMLLKEGFAQLSTYPPNIKYTERFTAAQREAVAAERGLWGAEADASPTGSQTPGLYVGSSSSNKYHFPDCQWAQKITPANQVWFMSKREAAMAGYESCGKCSP